MPLAFIALGANLPSPAGPTDATLAAAVTRLASLGHIAARSSLYSTAPVGFADQPRFLNAVVSLETSLAPRELLDALLNIEHEFGRDRTGSVPNGPRTLDLDLLLYDDLVLSENGLEVPHPRLAERAFVLVPLNEIAPLTRDPRSGRLVSELLQALRSARSDSPPDSIDDAIDAVHKIESNSWRAVGCGASSVGSSRPGADPDHG